MTFSLYQSFQNRKFIHYKYNIKKFFVNIFYKNGKKITIKNSTAEDREFLSKIAEQNGLIINWESTGASGSGWGDVALSEAFSINNNGEIEKIKIKPWIEKGYYHNSSSKTAKKFDK